MTSILRPAYAFYNRQYQARPILTICVTNAFLAGTSDTLTQKYLAPSTTPASNTKERISHRVSETVDHVQSNVQEGAAELAHTIDHAVHKNTSVDSTASATLESIKDKGGDYVHQGRDLVHQGKQQIQDQLAHSDLVLDKQTPTQDFARTGRFMFYNFSVAPIIHTWYTVLDKNFPIVAQTVNNKQNQQAASRIMHTLKPGLKRVAADQILFAPVGLAMLFTGLTVLEGGSLQQIKDKLNNTFIPTLKANYLVWPMVQLVNFSVMPLQLRLPFVSVVGIAWNAYLSLMNTRGQQIEKQNLVGQSRAAAQAIAA
ncbi:hypothetical protein EC991_006258 [Linnemannia zychae]|nr:hypothetical protein EC991_006258 [Linnemannia zychae]